MKAYSALALMALANVASAFTQTGPAFGVNKGALQMSAVAEEPALSAGAFDSKNLRCVKSFACVCFIFISALLTKLPNSFTIEL
jgi:hypothetical protein